MFLDPIFSVLSSTILNILRSLMLLNQIPVRPNAKKTTHTFWPLFERTPRKYLLSSPKNDRRKWFLSPLVVPLLQRTTFVLGGSNIPGLGKWRVSFPPWWVRKSRWRIGLGEPGSPTWPDLMAANQFGDEPNHGSKAWKDDFPSNLLLWISQLVGGKWLNKIGVILATYPSHGSWSSREAAWSFRPGWAEAFGASSAATSQMDNAILMTWIGNPRCGWGWLGLTPPKKTKGGVGVFFRKNHVFFWGPKKNEFRFGWSRWFQIFFECSPRMCGEMMNKLGEHIFQMGTVPSTTN